MERHELTRRRVLQLSGVGTAGAIAGCLGNGDDETEAEEDDEVHLLTDFSSEVWQDYWEEELVPSWEEQRPDVPLNVEYAGFHGTGEQRLATLMQAGDPPEFYHATLSELGDLVNQGQTTDVTDVVEDLEDTWGDEVLYRSTLMPIDDEVHSIPHGVYLGGVLNYRGDIYEELGLEVTLLAPVGDLESPTARSMPRPQHFLLEDINVHDGEVGHQHIDFVYYGHVESRAIDPAAGEASADCWEWFTSRDLRERAEQFESDVVTASQRAIQTVEDEKSSERN